MDFTALQRSLDPAGSTVRITTNTFPSPFGDFLASCYFKQGEQIVIDNAVSSADAAAGVVSVTGRASFLSCANLPVTATFSLDQQGDVQAALRYTLLDGAGSAKAWRFSDLLPDLPGELSPRVRAMAAVSGLSVAQARVAGVVVADQPNLLDTLSFLAASLVVTNGPHTDPDTKIAFESAGIHFVGQLRPASLIGALGAVLAPAHTVTMHGRIVVFKDETQLALPAPSSDPTAVIYPWEPQPALPGVHLQAALGLDVTVGKLALRDSALRIYSPPSAAVLARDELFQPVVAVTGSLEVPSAQIQIDAIARMPRAGGTTASDVLIETRCHGLSLGNLAHLADVAGAGDALSALPGPLARAIEGLDKLALLDVALLVTAGTSGIQATWASFLIGVPECRWQVWGDHLEVTGLAMRFAVSNPLDASRSIGTSVWGTMLVEGVPLAISASSSGDDFMLSAALTGETTIPLASLMKTWSPMLPAPANLTIDRMLVSIVAGKSIQMAGALAGQPEPWELALGPGKLAIENVAFDITVPATGDPSGSFRGDIAFGKDVTLSMAYTLPGDFVIRADCDQLSMRGLMATLSNQNVWLPDKLDITLLDSSILVTRTGNASAGGGASASNASLLFRLATQVDGLGCFAFEARELSAGTWGVAAGLDLGIDASGAGGAKASALPGLSGLAAFERMLDLHKLMLVVASYDSATFQFPDTAQFQNPRIGSGKVALPGHSGGLRAGVNLFAEWQIDGRDRTQGMLGKLLGLGATIGVTLQVAEDEARLFFRYDTRLMGHAMFGECGVAAMGWLGAAPEVSWFLTGSVTVKIQGHDQTFDVVMAVVPTGMLISGTMRGDAPVDLGPFKLARLALEVGVDVAGVPSLGLAGTIDAGNFESCIAVFFDATDPARSMAAGSISDLTLADVVAAFVPGTPSSIDNVLDRVTVKGTHSFTIPASAAGALDGRDYSEIARVFKTGGDVTIPASGDQLLLVANKPGTRWHLTDLTKMRHYQLVRSGATGAAGDVIGVSVEAQLYLAPQETTIGTIRFPAGFYVNAAIGVLGFDASVTVDIVGGTAATGISIDAQMDTIVIGNRALFSIEADKGGGGPRISIATFSQPDQEVPEFRPPHFYVNGKVTLLGLSQSVFITLTTKGFEFDLKGELAPGASFDLNGYFGGPTELGVGGSVKVGLGTIDLGALGKVKIDTDAEGSLAIAVKGQQITAAVDASFEALGEKHRIDRLTLDTSASSLAHLATTLAHEAEAVLRAAFADAARWAHAVEAGFVTGVDDTEAVLQNVFKKSAGEAKQIANEARLAGKSVAQATNQAANAAAQATNQAANAAAQQAQQAANAAAQQAQQAANAAAQAAQQATKAAGKEADKVGKAIGGLFKKKKK